MNILALTNLELTTLTASQEAQQQRDDLLVTASAIASIADQADAEDAGRALTSIKAFTRSIEDARKTVGAPVLDLTKRINALAASITAQLEDEANRLSRMIGTYNQEQERRAAIKRQEAYDEEQRIIADTRAKLAAATATGASDKKLEKIEDKAIAQLTEARGLTASIAAPKLAGVATRSELMYEITDITALYEANAAFVILSPNVAALKAALKALPEGKSLPGVRHWKEAKAIVR